MIKFDTVDFTYAVRIDPCQKHLQAVLAVFRGLKRFPGPKTMNMYRLSAHELCKSILVFFDDGKHWPNGLHSQIPACQDWALKTAKALVKLVTCPMFALLFLGPPN